MENAFRCCNMIFWTLSARPFTYHLTVGRVSDMWQLIMCLLVIFFPSLSHYLLHALFDTSVKGVK